MKKKSMSIKGNSVVSKKRKNVPVVVKSNTKRRVTVQPEQHDNEPVVPLQQVNDQDIVMEDNPGELAQQRTRRNKSSQVYLKTRMSPKDFKKFITGDLSDKQKQDIKDMGFGSLFSLKTGMVPGEFSLWLVSTFNPYKCSLMDEKLVITDEDIHHAIGIPMGPKMIAQATRYDKSPDYINLLNSWKSQFHNPDNILTTHVLDKMKQQTDGGDDFKRNFIVYVVSTLLSGSKGAAASLRILKALSNVDDIPLMNWCYYTKQALVDNVEQWQKDQKKFELTNKVNMFKGPIMVLIFIYLDRVVFKIRNPDPPRVFPTFSVWTQKAIYKRLKEEKDHCGAFGKGFVDPPFKKPESFVPISSPPVAAESKEGPAVRTESKDDPIKLNAKTAIDQLAFAAKTFAQAYEVFLKAIADANIHLPKSERVAKMSAFAESLLNGFSLSQKDNEFADDVHQDEYKKKGKEKVIHEESEEEGIDCQKRKFWDDDSFWNDKSVLADIFEFERVFFSSNVVSQHQSHAAADSIHHPSMTKPSASVELEKNDVDMPSSSHSDKTEQPHMMDIEEPSFKLINSQDFAPDPIIKDYLSSEATDLTPPTSKKSPSTSVCRRSPRFTPEALPKLPLLTETIVLRKRAVSAVYKSPFFQRNVDVFAELTQLQKDVGDYAFANNVDDSEILYRMPNLDINRLHLKTLHSPKVSDKIIEAWTAILNERETYRSTQSPYRLYLFKPNKDLYENMECSKVTMVFIPVTLPFLVLLCINVKAKKIELVHNLRVNALLPNTVLAIVDATINKDERRKFEWYDRLSSFKIEEFFHDTGKQDTGIWMMRHMELFKGQRGYKSAFLKEVAKGIDNVLKKLTVQYCHLILASDVNQLKEKVVLDARDFRIGKMKHYSSCPIDLFSDEEVRDFVSSPDKLNSMLVVDTEWIQVSRHSMKSLLPKAPLCETVIDCACILSTHLIQDVLYLPTTMRFLDSNKDKKLSGKYVRLHYMPSDGSEIKKLYLPIFSDYHWYLCICDLEKKKNFILDSQPERRTNNRFDIAATIVSNVSNIISLLKGYKSFKQISVFKYEHLDIPRQLNGYDCGMYVIKLVEALHNEELWTDKEYLSAKSLTQSREITMLKLIRWSANQIKVFA